MREMVTRPVKSAAGWVLAFAIAVPLWLLVLYGVYRGGRIIGWFCDNGC